MKPVNINSLVQRIAELRDSQNGCPWDLEQTHETLAPYVLEEAQEFISAIFDQLNRNKMIDELGDILLQILLHGQIASETNNFNLQDIIDHLEEKIIKRHPHVFNKSKNEEEGLGKLTVDEVKLQWNQRKQKETTTIDKLNDLLKLPPMLASEKIGKLSQQIYFDWDNKNEVFTKVKEELGEVEEVLMELGSSMEKSAKLEDEIGDLLFSTIQLARHSSISPEIALHKSNQKFNQRISVMLKLLEQNNKTLENLNVAEKEQFWQLAKREIKSSMLK